MSEYEFLSSSIWLLVDFVFNAPLPSFICSSFKKSFFLLLVILLKRQHNQSFRFLYFWTIDSFGCLICLVPCCLMAFYETVKTGPSFADAAVGRIAQGTKVLAEGGYEKIFRQTFRTVLEEQLLKTYACYLSTSAGPVMGVLYLSTAKLAFCSDNPLSYKMGEQTQWSYYKVWWRRHAFMIL